MPDESQLRLQVPVTRMLPFRYLAQGAGRNLQGGPTCLDNLGKLCRWHHRLKTYKGYRLSGGPGCWAWEAPRGRGERDSV